jgi:DNA-binding response OmpR family regulator
MKSTILVVDDEPDIVLMIRTILRSAGYEVMTAGSVREADQVLSAEEPDLVLLDIRLPDGEGWEILERLVEEGRHERLPVVMISAHSTPSTAVRALESGARAYIVKPFTADQLIGTIDTQLRAS